MVFASFKSRQFIYRTLWLFCSVFNSFKDVLFQRKPCHCLVQMSQSRWACQQDLPPSRYQRGDLSHSGRAFSRVKRHCRRQCCDNRLVLLCLFKAQAQVDGNQRGQRYWTDSMLAWIPSSMGNPPKNHGVQSGIVWQHDRGYCDENIPL